MSPLTTKFVLDVSTVGDKPEILQAVSKDREHGFLKYTKVYHWKIKLLILKLEDGRKH